MKSYYCFIKDPSKLKAGSFVYHVTVGTSQREQIKLALVREFCRDCKLFFCKWTPEVDSQLEDLRNRWKADGAFSCGVFREPKISIIELYQMIVDDSFCLFESSYKATKFEIWMIHRTDPKFIIQQNQINSITKCPTSRRQNLSSWRKDDGVIAAVGFMAILLIFVLDGVLECVLRGLFGSI